MRDYVRPKIQTAFQRRTPMKQPLIPDYLSVKQSPVKEIPEGATHDGLLLDHYERLMRSTREIKLLLTLYTAMTKDNDMSTFLSTLQTEHKNRELVIKQSASQTKVRRAMHEKERILDPIAKSITLSRYKEQQPSTAKQRADIIGFVENEMLRNLKNLDLIAKRKDSMAEIRYSEDEHDKFPRVVSATKVKECAQISHQKFSTEFDKLRFLLHDEVQA